MNKAVFDSGPLIHVLEIDGAAALKLFEKILISQEVASELKTGPGTAYKRIERIKRIEEKNLTGNSKDFAMILAEKFRLGLGESTSIALAKQEHTRNFFTDDLLARDIAKRFGFEAHGTIGIILRAFRERILKKNETIKKLNALHSSSLFITKPLIENAILEVKKFREKHGKRY